MEFIEYVASKAPRSIDDYRRYWHRYRELLEELNIAALPCNKWVLKLASHYLSWLSLTGKEFQLIAAKREELRQRIRLCRQVIEGRAEPLCPERFTASADPRAAVLQRAVLYSGVRAKHLWLLRGMEPVYSDDKTVVYDVRKTLGFKRINVIILPSSLAKEVLSLVSRYSYKTVQKYVKPPIRCFRRYHWNLCLKATGDRTLCGFIQGRWRPTDLAHYEAYVETSVEAQLKTWELARLFESGVSLRAILSRRTVETFGVDRGWNVSVTGVVQKGLLLDSNGLTWFENDPTTCGVKAGFNTATPINPQGISKRLRDSHEELDATARLLSLYSQFLG